MPLARHDALETTVVAALRCPECHGAIAVEGPDLLRVRMTAAAARSFVARAAVVVAAGRPPCPLCGAPLDPLGHICPRRNGHYVN